MVKYDPKNWFGFLFRRSGFQFRSMWRSLIIYAAFTASLVWIEVRFEMMPEEYHSKFPAIIHTVLGLVVGLLLVFRTNTAYDRWWEGRKQLGALVNTCRNLALKYGAYLPSEHEYRKATRKWISAFCWSLKEHLRDKDFSQVEQWLDASDKEAFLVPDHKPNYLIKQLSRINKDLLDKGIVSGEQLIILEAETTQLIDVLGACERIRKTPIPMGYALHLKRILLLYLFSLPFAIMYPLIWWTIPVCTMVFFTMIGIELLGEEIEDPFGTDRNDLPVDEIVETIRGNVTEILETE